MGVFTPVQDLTRGLRAYVEGVRWLRAHPRCLVALFIPVVAGLVFVAGGISFFVNYDQDIIGWVLFARPADSWLMLILWYVCLVLLYLATIVMVLMTSLLLMNVLASPIHEWVSTKIEQDVTGREPPPLSLRTMIRIALVEVKKVLVIVTVSILLLMIPGLNVISTLAAAFLIGWDFFDYPLARRDWSFRDRMRLVRGDFWAVMGLGLWLVIPVVQIVMLPLAVAGGTLLNLEALRREGHVSLPLVNREGGT